jgi:hypothetical protein
MIRWWRDGCAVPIEGGEDCPKCGRPMQRFRHSAGWLPLPGRGFFPLVGRVRRLRAHPTLRRCARRAMFGPGLAIEARGVRQSDPVHRLLMICE